MNEKCKEVSRANYHLETKVDFAPVNPRLAIMLLEEYFEWRKRRKKEDYIVVDDEVYYIDHVAMSKSCFFRSRSFSVYFVKKHSRSVIRISDHWSGSKYKRSRKLNCGNIGTCWWTCLKGERFSMRFPGEKYWSDIIAGVASWESMDVRE